MRLLKTYLKLLLGAFGALIVGFILFAVFKDVIQPRVNTIGVCSGEDSCLYTMLNGRSSVRVLGFVDENRRFLTAGGGGTLLHDATSGERLAEIDPSFDSFFTRISGDGTQIAAINRDFAALEVFDPAGELLWHTDVSEEYKIRDFVFVPIVKGFAFSVTNGGISVRHFPDGEPITTVPESEGAGNLAISNDGEILAGYKSSENAIYIWPLQDIYNVSVIEADLSVIPLLELNQDGSRLAAHGNSIAYIWNSVDGRLLLSVEREQSKAISLGFSANGNRLAVGFDDGWVEVWSVEDGELLLGTAHAQRPSTVALSTDGKLLAAGLSKESVAIRYTDAELRAMQRRAGGGGARFLSSNTTYIETTPGYGVVWPIDR